MAGSGTVGRVFGGGSASVGAVLMHNQRLSGSPQPLEPFFVSGSSSSFMGSSSMVSFKDVCGGKHSDRSFFQTYNLDEIGDDDFDNYFHQPEKKRRLAVEQVQFLEKSFEAENKLEPERKVQLAKDLGLQPRQVAIWFQNRRARWKTKQLEKDFDDLQASFNSLKSDYDDLLKEKVKLQAEVVHLTDKLNLKQKEEGDLSDSSNIHNQSKTNNQEPVINTASESEDAQISIIPSKQEDVSSAKSDLLDSDSSHYGDGGFSAFTNPADSSYGFEADNSDISQDDQDYLSKTLLPHPPPHTFPKIENLNLDLLCDDHGPLFWPC